MKRILSLFIVAALACQFGGLFAQESGEPSEQSVLDAARAKYRQDQAADPEAQPALDPASSTNSEAADKVPYTPILISFVPGVSFPFGYYDVSVAAGAIGNLSRDIEGVEGAGVFNITRDVRGVQGAGVFNIARDVRGIQSAGVFNIVDRDLKGVQGSGVFNIVRGKVRGLQGAGVFNIAGEIDGFQAAGVFNISGRVAGGQAAGIFNQAELVSGVQIGLVNIARHIDGIQIGLVNIAGNGVDSVSVSYAPSTGFAYAHWQMGTPAFFTVVGVGAPAGDWFRDYTSFTSSFGVGSRTRFFGLNLDLDLSAEQAVGALPFKSMQGSRDRGSWEGWAMIKPYPSIRLTVGLPFGRHFQLIGGLKADIDVDSLGYRVPAALKVGESWRGAVFNEGFTVWPEWFLGIKI